MYPHLYHLFHLECTCRYITQLLIVMLFSEEYDSYIVVSFTNATLVLSIGETVEEVTDSGFLGTSPTLACSRLGEDALIQVYTVYVGVHALTVNECLV